MREHGVGLESFYTPGFACGEEGKTVAGTFSLEVKNRFLKNLCWHLWFLISLESEQVIFSDNIATEITANEVGYLVS